METSASCFTTNCPTKKLSDKWLHATLIGVCCFLQCHNRLCIQQRSIEKIQARGIQIHSHLLEREVMLISGTIPIHSKVHFPLTTIYCSWGKAMFFNNGGCAGNDEMYPNNSLHVVSCCQILNLKNGIESLFNQVK